MGILWVPALHIWGVPDPHRLLGQVRGLVIGAVVAALARGTKFLPARSAAGETLQCHWQLHVGAQMLLLVSTQGRAGLRAQAKVHACACYQLLALV